MINFLENLFEEHARDNEYVYAHGSKEYYENTINTRKAVVFEKILNNILSRVDGNILEIGALTGTSTKVFCEVASGYNRSVVVLDPWEGTQEGAEKFYNQFLERTAVYENLKTLRVRSQDDIAVEQIKSGNFAFIFVDGLHTYEAVMKDMENCENSVSVGGIMCIDDVEGEHLFCPALKRAVHDFCSSRDNWKEIRPTGSKWLETYLLKIGE